MRLFCSVLPPNRWSMAYGLYHTAGTLAGSLGIFLVGMQKASWGIGYALSAMSALLLIALVVTAMTTFHLNRYARASDLSASPTTNVP